MSSTAHGGGRGGCQRRRRVGAAAAVLRLVAAGPRRVAEPDGDRQGVRPQRRRAAAAGELERGRDVVVNGKRVRYGAVRAEEDGDDSGNSSGSVALGKSEAQPRLRLCLEAVDGDGAQRVSTPKLSMVFV